MGTAKPTSPYMAGPNKPSTAIPANTTPLGTPSFPSFVMLPHLGAFGENFTTEELLETTVSIGDRFHGRRRCGQVTSHGFPASNSRPNSTRRHDRALRSQRPQRLLFFCHRRRRSWRRGQLELLGREEPTSPLPKTTGSIREITRS